MRSSQGFIFSASLLLFFGSHRKLRILPFFGCTRMLFLLLFFGCPRKLFILGCLLRPFLMCLECCLPAFATSRKLVPWLQETITHCASWMVAMIRVPLPRRCSNGMCSQLHLGCASQRNISLRCSHIVVAIMISWDISLCYLLLLLLLLPTGRNLK